MILQVLGRLRIGKISSCGFEVVVLWVNMEVAQRIAMASMVYFFNPPGHVASTRSSALAVDVAGITTNRSISSLRFVSLTLIR